MPKSTLAMRLSQNIAARRRALSLTQAQLAEALNVDSETLSRFERGKHLPSLQTLERLAALLQTSVAGLLAEVTPPVYAEATRITAWLSGLGSADRSFVLDQIKKQCTYLRSRSRPGAASRSRA